MTMQHPPLNLALKSHLTFSNKMSRMTGNPYQPRTQPMIRMTIPVDAVAPTLMFGCMMQPSLNSAGSIQTSQWMSLESRNIEMTLKIDQNAISR